MYYSSTEIEKLALTEMRCPHCGNQANVLISREVDFHSVVLFVNLWHGGKVSGTCGNCHGTLKLDKKDVYDMLEANGIEFRRSFWKKNLVSLTASAAILFVITNLI